MTASDARRALGYGTRLAALLTCAQYVISMRWALLMKAGYAVDTFDYGLNFVKMGWLLPLFCALPFGLSFFSDWKSGFAAPQVLRVGRARYTLSKAIGAALSGGLTLGVGALAFFGVCCLSAPMIQNPAGYASGPNLMDALAMGGWPLYVASIAYLNFMAGAFYALCGLCTSAWCVNTYFSLALPLVVNRMSSLLSTRLGLPFYLNLGMLRSGAAGLPFAQTLIAGTAVFGGLIAVCAALFALRVNRRLENG